MISKVLHRRGYADSAHGSRYVVSIRPTGLGDRLICLGAAWLFAQHTGRTLIADWRHGAYAINQRTNVFARCFCPEAELAGVPFIGDNRVSRMRLPRPRYPAVWEDDSLLSRPYRVPDHTFIADRDAAVSLIRTGHDVEAPTVIFDACVNDGLVSATESKTFLSALRPTPNIARAVANFRETRSVAGPIIGLHVRHGNGAATGHTMYWRSFQEAIDRCARAVGAARRHLGSDVPVFLCTDSAEAMTAIESQIPGVFIREKPFRPAGTGELHMWRDVHQVRDNAMVEMLLLADSAVLIRYPPGSFFSFYAAVMKRRQGPLPETVYELQQPYDRDDPLSPALLM